MNNVVPTRSQVVLICGRTAGCSTRLSAINRCSLCKRPLNFLPLHTAQVVGCVISATAAILPKLLLLGGTLPGKGSVTTSNTTRHKSAAALCVVGALPAHVLQRAYWDKVRLHRDSQAAEVSQRTYFRHFNPHVTMQG